MRFLSKDIHKNELKIPCKSGRQEVILLFFILNMTTGENHQFFRHMNSQIIPFNFCFNYFRYFLTLYGSQKIYRL